MILKIEKFFLYDLSKKTEMDIFLGVNTSTKYFPKDMQAL